MPHTRNHDWFGAPPPGPKEVTRVARCAVCCADPAEAARFYGHGPTLAAAERELAAVVGAWGEEREERSQRAWQGIEDVLREG